MFKFIKEILPWYLNPSSLTEIIPEIIKDESSIETKKSNPEMGLNEIIYGLGVLFVLFIIRVNL